MAEIIPPRVRAVSFDIFDTLAHRLVAAPVDVFGAVSMKLCASPMTLKYHDVILAFPQNRAKAEQDARARRVSDHGGEPEVTLDEIYAAFQSRTEAADECVQLLKETELALEKALTYRSRLGYKIYREAVDKGKVVIFISDMYLPPSYLVSFLNGLGYEKATEENVFVSGTFRVSKSSGKLFELVRERLALKAPQWLHVGDNEHSDIEMAKRAGARTLHAHWSSVKNIPTKRPGLEDSFIASLIKGLDLPQHREEMSEENKYFKLGYHVFGPIVFGYYAWLLSQFEIKKPDRVLFFARDAQLIMRIHELMLKIGAVHCDWTYDYVYISRKSTLPMGLVDYPLSRIDHWLPGKTEKRIEELIVNLGLDPKAVERQLDSRNLHAGSKIGLADRKDARAFLGSVSDIVLRKSAENREEFGSYLPANSSRKAPSPRSWTLAGMAIFNHPSRG